MRIQTSKIWWMGLGLCILSGNVLSPSQARAQGQSSGHLAAQEEKRTLAARPQDVSWGPELVFSVRDGKHLNQLTEKNSWYKELRQTGFYQGLLSRLGPVVFSPADDHGPGKNQWKGRLIDFLYSKFLEGHPLRLSYFGRPGLSSPFVVSVKGLSKTETAAIDTLIKAFRSMPDQVVSVGRLVDVSVTPIRIKQQKFAVVLQEGCFTIGSAPRAVGVESLYCRAEGKLSSDAQVSVTLKEFAPAVRGVAEKWLGLSGNLVTDFKWESGASRFVATQARVQLQESGHVILSEKVPEDLARAIPAGALAYAVGQVPRPTGGWAPETLEKFFLRPLSEQRQAKPMTVALTYLAIEGPSENVASKSPAQGGGSAEIESEAMTEKPQELPQKTVTSPTAAALLIHSPGSAQSLIKEFAATFNEKQVHEVFFRPLCGSVVAVTNSLAALQLLQQTCDKRTPSIQQSEGKRVAALQQKPLSGALFVNPGLWFSHQIKEGWRRTQKARAPATEIEASRRLLESLPSYLFVGAADAKQILMNAVQ